MSYYPITTTVDVTVTKQTGIAALEDFGALCYFTEDSTLDQGDVVKYENLEGIVDAGFLTTGSVYKYCSTFFAQTPTPRYIYIARVDTVGGDAWPATIEAALSQANFYAVGIDTLDLDEQIMVNIAGIVETKKLLWVQTRRYSDVLTIYQAISAGNYTRTALISKDADTDDNRLDAAWYGKCLSRDNVASGVPNWAYQTLTSVIPSAESNANITALLDAGVNVYVNYGNFVVTKNARTTATEASYIDQIVVMDYLRINIEQDVLNLILNSDKIPYTDAGIKTVEGVVLNRLNEAVTLKMLDSAVRPTATAPSVTTMSDTQKASRVAPTITATGRLSGAVNDFNINVNVEI